MRVFRISHFEEKTYKPCTAKDAREMIRCQYMIVPEQKARTAYDNLLRLIDDPDVRDPIKFLREREIVHYQRFGEPTDTKGRGIILSISNGLRSFHLMHQCEV